MRNLDENCPFDRIEIELMRLKKTAEDAEKMLEFMNYSQERRAGILNLEPKKG